MRSHRVVVLRLPLDDDGGMYHSSEVLDLT